MNSILWFAVCFLASALIAQTQNVHRYKKIIETYKETITYYKEAIKTYKSIL